MAIDSYASTWGRAVEEIVLTTLQKRENRGLPFSSVKELKLFINRDQVPVENPCANYLRGTIIFEDDVKLNIRVIVDSLDL